MVDRQKIEDETAGRDDCLEEETRFGAYSVVLKSAKDLNELLRTGLGLGTEDVYLEIHVPDSVRGGPRAVLETFKTGALELADFLREKQLRPGWLIGVTHQHVARPAQRFLDFQVISGIPVEAVDREKKQRIAEGYRRTKRREGGTAQGPLRYASVTRAMLPSWISPRSCGVGNRLNGGRPVLENALPLRARWPG
ncbi:MAG: hypothetical protein J4N92_05605 [Chloroflexi bacterium]|nr:hypothetical protein [Chloroflexota bacterium]